MSLDNTMRDFQEFVKRSLKQVEFATHPTEECENFPSMIHIEPTNSCNLHCIHCHHHETETKNASYKRPLGIMKMPLYQKIIDEIAPLHCAITLDVQGEPTLHPKFLDMVSYAKERGVAVSVITNATRLTESMSRELLRLKLNRIMMSFDSVNKEVYEKVRVRAHFIPTLKNILTFIKLNADAGHPTHVCVSMVDQKASRDHVDEFKTFFENLPIDQVFLNPLLNLAGVSGSSEEVELPTQQKSKPRAEWPICRVPFEYLTVNWDGEITACPVDVNVVYSAGNVAEESLKQIWNNERMRAFRRAHLTKDYSCVEKNGPLCGSCNCLWYPGYDLRDYETHAAEAITRTAVQFAPQFVAQSGTKNESEKYQNLLTEIAKLGG